MRDLNKLDYFDYVSDALTWGICAVMLYRVTCFKYLYGVSEVQEKIFFWVLSIVFIVGGLAVTIRKRRNRVSLVVNTFLPLTIHLIVSTFRYIPEIYTVVLTVAAVLSAVYFSLVVFKKIRNKKFKWPIIFKRVSFALLGTRTIAFALLFAVAVPVYGRVCLGYGLVSADADVQAVQTDEGEQDISANREVLLQLQEEKWRTLSMKEKINVLETVKDIEMERFGISCGVYLCAEPMEEGTLGSYSHAERKIKIDTEHLKSSPSYDVLKTVLHESMHAYQHRCAEVYDQIDEEYRSLHLFNNAAKYKRNLENYISGDDDGLGYYAQIVEVDAREYAEVAAEEYFLCIEALLNDKTSGVG